MASIQVSTGLQTLLHDAIVTQFTGAAGDKVKFTIFGYLTTTSPKPSPPTTADEAAHASFVKILDYEFEVALLETSGTFIIKKTGVTWSAMSIGTSSDTYTPVFWRMTFDEADPAAATSSGEKRIQGDIAADGTGSGYFVGGTIPGHTIITVEAFSMYLPLTNA